MARDCNSNSFSIFVPRLLISCWQAGTYTIQIGSLHLVFSSLSSNYQAELKQSHIGKISSILLQCALLWPQILFKRKCNIILVKFVRFLSIMLFHKSVHWPHETWSHFFLNKNEQRFFFQIAILLDLMWGFRIYKFKNRALRA